MFAKPSTKLFTTLKAILGLVVAFLIWNHVDVREKDSPQNPFVVTSAAASRMDMSWPPLLQYLGEYLEFAKFGASDSQISDHFGKSVAVSGGTAVVGSWSEDGGPGDPNPDAGAVYVFESNNTGLGGWNETARLGASDAQAADYFGWSVAMSGDTVVVGAFGEDGGTGDPLDDAGAAYIFERDYGGPNNWGQVKKLAGSDVGEGYRFGLSVSISGNTIVVGATGAPAVPGSPSPIGGAVYIFERDMGGPGNWGEAGRLVASDSQDADYFGGSVAIDADTIVVGAELVDLGSPSSQVDAGAAYIFERDLGGPGNWGEAAKLIAWDNSTKDYFGASVSINGNTVVVGADSEDGGVGDPLPQAGAAYVFERDLGGTGNWGYLTKLVAWDAQAMDYYGSSVAISGDAIVIGAPFEDGGPGDPIYGVGAVYIYERDIGGIGNWGESAKLLSSDGQIGDEFGASVAIQAGIVLIGAIGEAAGPGDPMPGAGAVYLFKHLEGVLFLPIILR